MNNKMLYSKEGDLIFELYRIKIKDIPVLVPEPLSIYQKFIILILDKGIISDGKVELVNRLSSILNIKVSFVNEFIEILWRLSYLKYDEFSKLFTLSENYKIIIDEKDQTIMKGNLLESKKTIDDIYFFDDENKFVSRSFFEKSKTNLLTSDGEISDATIDKIKALIDYEKHVNDIKILIYSELKNEGIIPDENYHYQFERVINKYQIKLDCTFIYEYVDGKGLLKDITSNMALPKVAITNYICNNPFDKKVPKFISLQDSHYSKISQNDKELSQLLHENGSVKLRAADIKSDIDLGKATLNVLEMGLGNTIETIDSDLKISKSISGVDVLIKKNEDELRELNNSNEFVENEIEKVLTENSKLFADISLQDEDITKTFKKYRDFKSHSILLEKVICICTNINQAIEASEHNAFYKLENIMQTTKDINKQTLKIIFDVLFENNSTAFSDYFHTKRYVENENKLKSKKIDFGTFFNLKQFHEMSNAYGHLYDEFYRGDETNKDKVQWFQNLEKQERRKILISPITFLSKIELTEYEMDTIERKFFK